MKGKVHLVVFLCFIVGLLSCCSKKAPTVEYMSGYVKDMDGLPISEAVVKSNSFEVQTDQNGFFSIEHVQNVQGRYVVLVSKKGYFPVVRSQELGTVGLMEVVLVKENVKDVSTKTTFTASKGAKVSVGKTVVDFPADGVMYEDGTPYKGKVNVNMLYLDPQKPTFQAAMPGGDLIAQRSDLEQCPLVSYGMVNVRMEDAAGKKLQINEGKKSKVTFPIPDGMSDKAPDQMPLWHFNESKGIWEESGVAIKNGDVYEGEVEHFSWVNLDDPKQFVVLKGKVTDDKGNRLSGVKIIIEQVSAYSNEDGEYSVRIPSETPVNVTVRKEDYLNYDNEFSVLIEGQPGNSTYTQDIQLPSFPSIKGKLENMCDKDVVFPLSCTYELDGVKSVTPFTLPNKDGEFSVMVPTNAQNVQLCVKVPGGDDVVNDIAFAGVDYQLATNVVICRKNLADREKPRITIDGKEILLENNELDYSDFNKNTLTVRASDMELTIEKYDEHAKSLNGQVSIDKHNFKSNTARIEKNKVNNHVTLSIVATGKAQDETGAEKDAVFEGTYVIPFLFHGKCDDFSQLCWDPELPPLRTPMSYVEQYYLMGMPTTNIVYDKVSNVEFKCFTKMTENVEPFALNIGYGKADQKTYDKIIAMLDESGYTKDDSQSGKIFYTNESGDITICIRYEKNHYYEFLNGGSKMKMVVQVYTGTMKWFKNLIKRYLGLDWLS